MSVNVITLGKEGKLDDPDLKIDYIMNCYFFSKYSQSTLFAGKITSLTKVIQMYGDDAISIRKEVEESLQAFLNKFFTTASVEVTVEDTGVNPGIKLQINAIVSDGASISPNSYSVGYSLMVKDSTLKSILNIQTRQELLDS